MKKNGSQLKAGILLGYVNTILGNLIPLFYTPVMLSLLGKSEYGLYKLSSGLTSYLSLLSLGIGVAVTRYLIKANTEDGKDGEERVLGLFMMIFQAIGLLTLIVGTILMLNLHIWYGDSLSASELSRMKILVMLMVCNTALNFMLSPYVSVVNAHEKFVFLQLMNIVGTCFIPLLNIVVLFLGYASVGMATVSLALGILCRFAYFLYVRYSMNIRVKYKNLPLGMLKEILIFSFWIFVANVVSQLNNSTDTVMIGASPNLSTSGVAVYNVGAVFNNMVVSLTAGISALLSPKANKMVMSGASGGELTDLSVKVGRIQGYIITLIVSGFIVFGKPFIYFYAGEDYSDAYWVAVLMMIPNVIPLVQSVCLSIIIARNQHRFRSIVYLGIAVVNVIATYFLIKSPLGIIGAALATGVSLLIGQGFVMNKYYQKKTELFMGRFWAQTGKIFIVPAVLCLIALFVSRLVDFYTVPALLSGIVCYTAIYSVLSWLFIMNDYEKGLITQPLKRILHRQ